MQRNVFKFYLLKYLHDMSCTASTRKKEKGRYGSHRGYRFGIECMSIGTVAESEKKLDSFVVLATAAAAAATTTTVMPLSRSRIPQLRSNLARRRPRR